MTNRSRDAKYFIGQTFGSLTVEGNTRPVEKRTRGVKQERLWVCRCACGNRIVARASNVKNGTTESCGCSRRRGHGMARTPEHKAWVAIKQRCFNPNASNHKNYGARGITMCDEWLNDFAAFYLNVGPRPSARHSIERINNNGNYEPGNVRWATAKEQMRNRRNSRLVTFENKTLCVSAWAEHLGLTVPQMVRRLRNWPLKRALTKT